MKRETKKKGFIKLKAECLGPGQKSMLVFASCLMGEYEISRKRSSSDLAEMLGMSERKGETAPALTWTETAGRSCQPLFPSNVHADSSFLLFGMPGLLDSEEGMPLCFRLHGNAFLWRSKICRPDPKEQFQSPDITLGCWLYLLSFN